MYYHKETSRRDVIDFMIKKHVDDEIMVEFAEQEFNKPEKYVRGNEGDLEKSVEFLKDKIRELKDGKYSLLNEDYQIHGICMVIRRINWCIKMKKENMPELLRKTIHFMADVEVADKVIQRLVETTFYQKYNALDVNDVFQFLEKEIENLQYRKAGVRTIRKFTSIMREINKMNEPGYIGRPGYRIIDNIKIDLVRHRVFKDNKIIYTTDKEFQIISLLVLNKDHLISREEMIRRIWDNNKYTPKTRALDMYISKIRKKSTEFNDRIKTVHCMGYKFV